MIENSQPGGGYLLHVGGKQIPFCIVYRRRKRLAITVHPDLRLEIVAPEGCASEKVVSRVDKRSGWILRQWRYFEQFLPKQPSPQYISGETHLYLGRQYRLKVRQGSPETVKLVGRFLHVWVADRSSADRISLLLERWYREHAERIFALRLRICLEQCASLKLPREPRLMIRKMSHRWGSCTRVGNVLLNLDLIKSPVHCVDYVIMHELCHLKVRNHSPAYYRLLRRLMPDWERRKQRLEEHGV